VKVVVLNNGVPFVRGGAEHLADSLVEQLLVRGHEAELVRLPLRWHSPEAVADSMAAAAAVRMPEADRVIALKFPAYLVPHENKVVWLLHQFRQVYDLWDTPLQDLPNTPETHELRRAIIASDTRALRSARGLYCNSSVTADRLQRYNGLTATVLHPPHGDEAAFEHREYGNYVLAIGRVTASKRQHLLVQAMAHAPAGVRLVIAGAPETPHDGEVVQRLVDELGVADRVELILRFITDEEKVDLLSRARAVAYLPHDEDSYGYVTVEGMLSEKPVITTDDSGGILQLVRDEATGLVTPPQPEALGVAMGRLCADEKLAATLGRAGHALVGELNLSWDSVLETLLS
jgi:glycosyltransferase involved in cell wall biosynthesis